MDWRAHSAIGAVFSAGSAYLLGAGGFIELVFFAFFGSLCALLPDLDHDHSKGRKILDTAAILVAAAIGYLYACRGGLCIPVSGAVPGLVVFLIIAGAYFVFFKLFKPRHRGITHTIAAALAFGIFVFLAAGLVPAVCGFSAYFSHLLADRQIKFI